MKRFIKTKNLRQINKQINNDLDYIKNSSKIDSRITGKGKSQPDTIIFDINRKGELLKTKIISFFTPFISLAKDYIREDELSRMENEFAINLPRWENGIGLIDREMLHLNLIFNFVRRRWIWYISLLSLFCIESLINNRSYQVFGLTLGLSFIVSFLISIGLFFYCKAITIQIKQSTRLPIKLIWTFIAICFGLGFFFLLGYVRESFSTEMGISPIKPLFWSLINTFFLAIGILISHHIIYTGKKEKAYKEYLELNKKKRKLEDEMYDDEDNLNALRREVHWWKSEYSQLKECQSKFLELIEAEINGIISQCMNEFKMNGGKIDTSDWFDKNNFLNGKKWMMIIFPLLLLSMISCKGDPETQALAVVIDETEEYFDKFTIVDFNSYSLLSKNHNAGELVHIRAVNDMGVNKVYEFSVSSPPNNKWQRNEMQRYHEIEHYKDTIEYALNTISTDICKREYSYVIKAISEELNWLQKIECKRKLLIITGDLNENSPVANFYDANTFRMIKTSSVDFQKLFTNHYTIPDLSDITIHFLYTPINTIDSDRYEVVSKLYADLFVSHGAIVLFN